MLRACLGWLCQEDGEGEKTSEGRILPSQPPSPPHPWVLPFPCQSSFLIRVSWSRTALLDLGTCSAYRLTVHGICRWAWLSRKRLPCHQSIYGCGARVVGPVLLEGGRRRVATSFYCQEEGGRRVARCHAGSLSSPLLTWFCLSAELHSLVSTPHQLAGKLASGSAGVSSPGFWAHPHVRPSLPEEPNTALDTRTRTVHQDLKKGSSPRPDALGLQLRCAPLLTSL